MYRPKNKINIMGIIEPFFKIILAENSYKNFSGKLTVIGKQTLNVEKKEVIKLLEKENIDTSGLKKVTKFDNSTRYAKNSNLSYFFDHDVLEALGHNIKYSSLDRSDYEGAKIIQDMNMPLKKKYFNNFDIVIDGGTMDNLFNPVNFLQNVVKMLKPGGRAILGNHFFQTPGAYLAYSPEYYFSFFSVNNFKDIKIFIIQSKNVKDYKKNRHRYFTEIYSYKPYFTPSKNYDYHKAVKNCNTINNVVCIAEKGKSSTWNKIPCQSQYLDKKEIDWRKNYFRYKKFRKNLIKKKINSKKRIFNSDHFELLDNNF